MNDWTKYYRQIDAPPVVDPASGPLASWQSLQVTDTRWDDFLRSSDHGHYQQSSLWADYKSLEGWHHHRIVLTSPAEIVGGFQLLWKKTRLGRIGYMSKAPVLHAADPALGQGLRKLIETAVRELGLIALIGQFPDDSEIAVADFEAAGFVRSNPMHTIESTYLIDARQDPEILRRNMGASLRRDLRKSHSRGVVIREGTEADIPLFFELMAAACRRQNTTPNPVSVEAIRRLWAIFAPSHSIRMTLAQVEGSTPSAQMSLIFGRRVSLWKKGWDGTHGDKFCNALLENESLEWAHVRGHHLCDFCSLERSTAQQMLSGKKFDEQTVSTRDRFNLRFGGYAKLLPPALIYIPNPGFRWGYRNILMRFARFR